MNEHDRSIIHSSEESKWRTPKDCFAKLDQEFDFEIDLAADAESCLVVKHDILGTKPRWFGPGSPFGREDALTVAWTLRRPGFLNPPFSKTLMNAYNTGRIKRDGQWVDHPKDPALARAYDIGAWAEKCWEESRKGATIVGVFPFAPQTDWYRQYIFGFGDYDRLPGAERPTVESGWSGHAAMEERRLPHRISFLRPDGSPAGNAGVNSVIVVWKPNPGYLGSWQPAVRYWSYR